MIHARQFFPYRQNCSLSIVIHARQTTHARQTSRPAKYPAPACLPYRQRIHARQFTIPTDLPISISDSRPASLSYRQTIQHRQTDHARQLIIPTYSRAACFSYRHMIQHRHVYHTGKLFNYVKLFNPGRPFTRGRPFSSVKHPRPSNVSAPSLSTTGMFTISATHSAPAYDSRTANCSVPTYTRQICLNYPQIQHWHILRGEVLAYGSSDLTPSHRQY